MKRELWCCPSCPQTSTRHWNLKTHIKRRHGGIGLPFCRAEHAYINYNENIKHRQSNGGINPTTGELKNPHDFDSFAGLDKAQEAADKLVEINECYSKVYHQAEVQHILKTCMDKYATALDPAVLDFDVVAATKISRFFETLRKINFQSTTFHSASTARDADSPTKNFMDDALKRFEDLVRQRSQSDINSSVVPTTPDLSFLSFMSQFGIGVPSQESSPTVPNTDPKIGGNRSSSTETSSPPSSSDDPSESPERFSPTGTAAIPSPTRKDDENSTAGLSISTERSSISTRPARRKKSALNKSQLTARKLAALETVLLKFLPPLEVEKFVTECRDHARTHGHTRLADDLLKSARIVSLQGPSNFAAARSQK